MSAQTVTWVVVSKFDAPVDMNDDGFLNAIAEVIERFGGTAEDSIVGNLIGTFHGSLDSAFDAARGELTTEPRS